MFRLSDFALFVFTLFGSAIGLYRMRILNYHKRDSSNAEFLDEILLIIGLTGELIHSSTGERDICGSKRNRVDVELKA